MASAVTKAKNKVLSDSGTSERTNTRGRHDHETQAHGLIGRVGALTAPLAVRYQVEECGELEK